MDNPVLVIAVVGLCIFIFLAFLVGYGQMMGGNWLQVSRGVTSFIVVIVVFMVAALTIVVLARRR